MALTELDPFTERAATRINLLRTLWWFSTEGQYPTATELIRECDARQVIPRPTMQARRKMIAEMKAKSLISVHSLDKLKHDKLEITEVGIDLIKRLDGNK